MSKFQHYRKVIGRHVRTRSQFQSRLDHHVSFEPASSESSYSLSPYLKTNSIFVHVPKAAGVSIATTLYGCLAGGHMTVCDYVDAFSPFRFIRAFKFAIVRNPWQRLYSAYRFLEKGGMNQADARLADQVLSSHPSFAGFIRNWLTRENAQRHVHFRTQTSFLFDTSAHIYVDFIGFLENIDADFSTIVDKTGISRSLAHTNRSTESSALKGLEGLGEREVQVVEEIYAEDFHTFGYPRYSDTEIASLLSNVHEGSFFASRLREQRRSTSAKKQAD